MVSALPALTVRKHRLAGKNISEADPKGIYIVKGKETPTPPRTK